MKFTHFVERAKSYDRLQMKTVFTGGYCAVLCRDDEALEWSASFDTKEEADAAGKRMVDKRVNS